MKRNSNGSYPFRIALFNYIPHGADDPEQKLISKIEQEFQEKYPEVDLDILPISYEYDLYDFDQLTSMLTDTSDGPTIDLLEIDATIMLQFLVDKQLISSIELPDSQWHPAAIDAVQLYNATYGVPSWLCSHFTISGDSSLVGHANTVDWLSSQNGTTVFDFKGSWNTIGLYADGTVDEYGHIDTEHLHNPTQEWLGNLSGILNYCRSTSCMDGSYSNPIAAAKQFSLAPRQTTLIGYAETMLNAVRATGYRDKLHIHTLNLSHKGNQPLVFADAWVKRRNCTSECSQIANNFVQYITSPKVQEWIIRAQDQKTHRQDSVPRYLIPANKDTLRELDGDLALVKQAFLLLERKIAVALPAMIGYVAHSQRQYYQCHIKEALNISSEGNCSLTRVDPTEQMFDSDLLTRRQFFMNGILLMSPFIIGFASRLSSALFKDSENIKAIPARILTGIAVVLLLNSSFEELLFPFLQILLEKSGFSQNQADAFSWIVIALSSISRIDIQQLFWGGIVTALTGILGCRTGIVLGEKVIASTNRFFNSGNRIFCAGDENVTELSAGPDYQSLPDERRGFDL